jgi:GWxTD domain-containing protein
MRALLFLAFAALVGADERIDELPEPHRKWLKEEVPYIITDVEKETFLSLETEKERTSFVEAFWRKRDNNPSTPENEYRLEHYERLAYANEFFGRDTVRPGWQTDRGRYYILLGKPNTRLPLEGKDQIYPSELWFYNDPNLKYVGLPPFFYLLFFRRHGSGELQLYSPLSDGPQALLTGYQSYSMDFRDDVARAYEKLFTVDPELAQASLSFRTDEGDVAQFQNPSFGTLELLEQVADAPFYGLDTSYAERLDFERGNVESDYLFTYVQSSGVASVLPGPHRAHYLHWVIELDAQHVSFVRDEDNGKYGSVFIATVEIVPRDDENRLALEIRKESFLTLNDQQAKEALKLPFAYSGMTPLVPGSYRARVVLRNRACPSRRESDCLKSYTLFESEIEVPEWQEERPELSGVVLAYGTELVGNEDLYRPFRAGKLEILPNASGVYAIGEALVVGVEPRNAPPGAALRFEIASAETDGRIWTEKTVDIANLGPGPLIQEFSLEGFEGGRYLMAATLLDGEGRERDRKASAFTVSPRTSIPRPSVRGSIPSVRPEIPGVVSLVLAEQYVKLEDPLKARALLERSILENNQLAPARELLAKLLGDSGEFERVIAVLEPLHQNVPDRFEVVSVLGEAYFQRQDFAKAVELLERALTLGRLEPRHLNALGTAHSQLGDVARAIEILGRSLSSNPDQPAIKQLVEELKASGRSGRP